MSLFIDSGFLAFSFLGSFCLCFWLSSGCNLLFGNSLGSDSNGPDKTQQLSGYCCDNLPLVLAGCAQFHIALMQSMLRLPRDLFHLFRDAFLSSAQSVPDTWRTTIAPCCFDNDSSQVCVASFRDASTPGSLARWNPRWEQHRNNPLVAEHFRSGIPAPTRLAMVTAEMSAIPRSACRSLMTCCKAGEASFTASMMACSRRATRSRMCSTSCR